MAKVLKILAFSDLHCNADAAATIAQMAPRFDLVIGAGDFATMRSGLNKTIDKLRAIDRPTVIVPGNSESVEELQNACQGWSAVTVLHGSGTVAAGVPVFGMGGAVPVTPFGPWSYDFTEDQAASMLESCPERCLLVSHSPPFGFADVSSLDRHFGSRAVRETIERCRPLLVVCGHIHACWRQRHQLGPTILINAGPQPYPIDLPLES